MSLSLLSLIACSEYALAPTLPDPEMVGPDGDGSYGDPGTDDDHDGDPPGAPSDPTDSEGNGSPDPSRPWEGTTPPGDPDLPPSSPPPSFLDEDCPADQLAPFSSDEIWVGNDSGNAVATGLITAPQAGWYHVYNTHIVESGASQHNESAFFRVESSTHPQGLPAFGNCDDEWVVVDADNQGPPPGNQTLIGTFWLDAGDNELVMTHYCQLYAAGACPEYHVTDEPSQTCESGNINSVHFLGFGVCLVPAG